MIMYIHISYHVDYNPSGNLFIYIIIPVYIIAAILLVVGQNTHRTSCRLYSLRRQTLSIMHHYVLSILLKYY